MRILDEDYTAMAGQITEDGHASIEYEKDGEVIFVECDLFSEGYYEDDIDGRYFVPTLRQLTVTSCESFDDDGSETENDFDASRLEECVA